MRALPFLAPLVVLMLAFPAAAQDCVPYLTRSQEEMVSGHPFLQTRTHVDTGRPAYDATGGSSCDGPIEDISCDAGHRTRQAATGQEDPGPRQGTRHYFVLETCNHLSPFGLACSNVVWWYAEANGIDGLQRRDGGHDLVSGTWGIDDTCGLFPPDLLIF